MYVGLCRLNLVVITHFITPDKQWMPTEGLINTKAQREVPVPAVICNEIKNLRLPLRQMIETLIHILN